MPPGKENPNLHGKRHLWERLARSKTNAEHTRAFFATLRARSKGNVVDNVLVARLALETDETCEDAFADDGRIGVDHDGAPVNWPASRRERDRQARLRAWRASGALRRWRARTQQTSPQNHGDGDDTLVSAADLAVLPPTVRDDATDAHADAAAFLAAWSPVAWNDDAVDPAAFVVAVPEAEARRAAKMRQARGEEEEEPRDQEEDDLPTELPATSEADARRTAKRAKLDEKLDAAIDAVLWRAFQSILEDGRRDARAGRLLRQKRVEADLDHNEHVKRRRELGAARLAAVEAARRHELILAGTTARGNDAAAARSVLDIDDAAWATRVVEARQRTTEVVRRAARHKLGDVALHDAAFNDVVFEIDVAASLRRQGVDATLAEIGAVWREVLDEVHAHGGKGHRREAAVSRHDDVEPPPTATPGGHHHLTGATIQQMTPSASVEAMKSMRELRYDILAVEDFARWMRDNHGLLRGATAEEREQLHLVARIAPPALLAKEFRYWEPLLARIDRRRVLDAVHGDASLRLGREPHGVLSGCVAAGTAPTGCCVGGGGDPHGAPPSAAASMARPAPTPHTSPLAAPHPAPGMRCCG